MEKFREFAAKFGDGKGLNPNTLLRTIAVALICITIIIIVTAAISSKNAEILSRTEAFGLKDIGMLITQEGYYTNVQCITDKRELWGVTIPFTTSKYIYSYSGKVTAGLDFSQIEIVTDEKSKTVTVKLPAVTLYDINIDNDTLKIYDESQSIFTPLSVKDLNDAQIAIKEEVRVTAVEQGILQSATKNAETLITGILSAAIDSEQYTIVYEETSAE